MPVASSSFSEKFVMPSAAMLWSCFEELFVLIFLSQFFPPAGGRPVRPGKPFPEITGKGNFWVKPAQNRIGLRFMKKQDCVIAFEFPTHDDYLTLTGVPRQSDANTYFFGDLTGRFDTNGWADFDIDTTGQVWNGTEARPILPLKTSEDKLHVVVASASSSCAVQLIKGTLVDGPETANDENSTGWPIWASVACAVVGIVLVAFVTFVVVYVFRRRRKTNKTTQEPKLLKVEQTEKEEKLSVPAEISLIPPPPSSTARSTLTPQVTPPPPSSTVLSSSAQPATKPAPLK